MSTATAIERELCPGKQLFVDDYFIESLQDAHRVFHPPTKLTVDEPLPIALDQPWDSHALQLGQVVYDERHRMFRMYYRVPQAEGELICALDSDDGIHWHRPCLNLVEFNGSRANNITNCPSGYLPILWDPWAGEEKERWRRSDVRPQPYGAEGQAEWRGFHSADGYRWFPYPPGPHSRQQMLSHFGAPADTFGGVVNPDARYMYYTQRGSNRRTRVLGRRDSADYLNWSGLRTVIEPDLRDIAGTEFYGAGYDIANRTQGGLSFLVLSVFHTDPRESYAIADPAHYWGPTEMGPAALAARVDGVVDLQLASSRDTVSWKRFREPLVSRGEPGAWDWGTIYGDGPILHDDKLWFFYLGRDLSHNGRGFETWRPPYAQSSRWGKGLAQLRVDGYVSVEARGWAPGSLTTHRFRQESGGTARVNVDASAGELRYEMLEDDDTPIPGFGADACDPIRVDSLDHPLSWQGRQHWPGVTEMRSVRYPELAENEYYVKIRFVIAPGTKLYSVTIQPPQVMLWQSKIATRID